MRNILSTQINLRNLGLSASLVAALCATLPVQAQVLGTRNPAMSREKAAEQLADIGVKANLKLVKEQLDLLKSDLSFAGVNLQIGVKPSVERSFHNELTTRQDRYTLNLSPGISQTVSEASDSSFSVGVDLQNDLEFKFVRQFKKAEDAFTATPYFYKNLPFDHKRALENMNVGDFFTMKANMGIVVSGQFLNAMTSHLALELGAHYLLNGAFQVHTLRLPDDKVRLKLVGLRTSEVGINAGIGFEGVIDVFKVKFVDKALTRTLDLDPVKFTANKGTNNLFMVDYTIDLKDQKSREAFDLVMQNATDLKKSLKILKPGKSQASLERLKQALIMDIEPLDQISRDEQQLSSQASVLRSFKGSMNEDYQNKKLKLGNRLIETKETKEFSRSNIVSEKLNQSKDYYQLTSYNLDREASGLFGVISDKTNIKMNLVTTKESALGEPRAQDLVIAVRKQDKIFQNSEFEETKQQLFRDLPQLIFDKIDFSKWSPEGKTQRRAVVDYKFVIHQEAFDAVPVLDKNQIYTRYIDYLKKIGGEKTGSINDLFKKDSRTDGRLLGPNDVEDNPHLTNEVEKIAKIMAKAFDRNGLSKEERLSHLMELRHNDLFLKSGIRFLLELLPQDEKALRELVHVELNMRSKDGGTVEFPAFGDRKESEIYRWTLLIQNLIKDSSMDLILEGEKLTMENEGLGQSPRQ